MRAVIALVVVLLAHGARDAATDPTAAAALGVGVILIVAYYVGQLLERFKLPHLTGYILAGLAVGPDGLGLIGVELGTLALFNGTAIALIALTAGSELELRALRPLARSIVLLVTFAVVAGAAAIALTAFAAFELGLFLDDLPTTTAIVVCGVLGVVLAAQSPAVIVAIRKETGARGPLTDTTLGAVVVGDLLVIVLFAVAATAAGVVVGDGASLTGAAAHLAWHVLGSIAIGAGIGLALGATLRLADGGAPMLVLIACVVLAEVGERVELDPIVVAVTAGILIRNRMRDAFEKLEAGIEAIAAPMYVLFFAVAGASLHLDVLASVGVVAFVLVLARAGGLLAGGRLGAALGGAPDVVRRYGAVGLLPQAGLALALALVFAEAFPELGPEPAALALGVVALNELIAPAIWRVALTRSGEARAGA